MIEADTSLASLSYLAVAEPTIATFAKAQGEPSYVLQLGDRSLIRYGPGIDRGLRLQQEHVRLVVSNGKVLDSARDDRELAGLEFNVAVA